MRSIPFASSFGRASNAKRFWLSGGSLAAFLLTLIIGNHFIAADRSVSREMLGHDFLAFYTAGSFVRDGRYHELYDLDSVRDYEQATAHAAGLEVGKSFGPWWNPPFYALVFEPLAALPYAKALDCWRWISVTAVILAIAILTTFVARSKESSVDTARSGASATASFKHWGLVPVLILISMPFIQAFSHGQNTFTSLLLLTVTVALWRGERRLLAGVACGLLFYKPQLGAVVAAAMVLDLGLTALAGVAITGIALILVTMIALPGSLGDWVHQLPANVRWMQVEHAYLWERHVTLKGFWRLLLQGREAGEANTLTTILTDLSLVILGVSLAAVAILHRFKASMPDGQSVRRDRLIAAAICAMPLLMPFYFDYDLLLLAVPATLYAAERVQRPQLMNASEDRILTAGWVLLFAWLFVNPAFAFHSHFSGSVLLLAGITILTLRRVNRPDGELATVFILRPQRLATAA